MDQPIASFNAPVPAVPTKAPAAAALVMAQFSQAGIVDFGSVRLGRSATASLHITNPSIISVDIDLSGIPSDGSIAASYLQGEPVSATSVRIPVGGKETAIVTFTWTPPAQSVTYNIRHTLTVFNGSHRFAVRVVGECIVPLASKNATSRTSAAQAPAVSLPSTKPSFTVSKPVSAPSIAKVPMRSLNLAKAVIQPKPAAVRCSCIDLMLAIIFLNLVARSVSLQASPSSTTMTGWPSKSEASLVGSTTSSVRQLMMPPSSPLLEMYVLLSFFFCVRVFMGYNKARRIRSRASRFYQTEEFSAVLDKLDTDLNGLGNHTSYSLPAS